MDRGEIDRSSHDNLRRACRAFIGMITTDQLNAIKRRELPFVHTHLIGLIDLCNAMRDVTKASPTPIQRPILLMITWRMAIILPLKQQAEPF